MKVLFDLPGPKYIRFAREATPIVTREDSPLEFGKGNIMRYRGEAESFVDAFDISLAYQYKNEREALTIISCGPETAEAMRAAQILKEEFGLETRVLHLHAIKPIDTEAIVRAAGETGAIITAEEHQVGGLGNLVAGVIGRSFGFTEKALPFEMIGVPDRFGESGQPWQLIKKFGLSAEHIAERARQLLDV